MGVYHFPCYENGVTVYAPNNKDVVVKSFIKNTL